MSTPNARRAALLAAAALTALSSCATRAIEAAKARKIVASMSADDKAGQLIMLSLPGSGALSAESRGIVMACKPGAVILFGFNVKGGPAAVRSYTSSIQDAASSLAAPVLVAVDHEGGLVQRLASDGFTRLPSPEEAGAILDPRGLEELGALSARELAAVGVRMNLAPVAEHATEESRAFLGSRAYSADADRAGLLAAAFAKGTESAGVCAVYKHFPGNSSADPHVGLPVLRGTAEEIERGLLKPFRGSLSGYRPGAVMLSHAQVPALDPRLPSSLSPGAVRLLRKGLRYKGVILTDDLEMGALRDFGGPGEAAVLAIEAGADMLMLSTSASALRVKEAVLGALASGRLAPGALDAPCERIIRLKLALGLEAEADPAERAASLAAFRAAAEATAKFVRDARSAADTEGGKAAR